MTFGTPFGRYHFKRFPFGEDYASEAFQAKVPNIISGIEGCTNSQDDILVWGVTKEDHDQELHSCFTRISQSGLKLNQSKCILPSNLITFLGHIFLGDGVKPDPTKVNAITYMPIPISKVDLQCFLGMVNYVAKFVHNLSQITAPLRLLVKKDISNFVHNLSQITAPLRLLVKKDI